MEGIIARGTVWGKPYEILNMYFYALYYYRKAAVFRPRDARMWIAIAQCYEKLNRDDDAIKGYESAAQHDDQEGHALLKLARLHRGRASHDEAFACYSHYARLHADTDAADLGDATAAGLAIFATAHKKSERYDEAQTCLGKLLDYPGPEKLEARTMLREIRALVDPASSVPADVMGDCLYRGKSVKPSRRWRDGAGIRPNVDAAVTERRTSRRAVDSGSVSEYQLAPRFGRLSQSS